MHRFKIVPIATALALLMGGVVQSASAESTTQVESRARDLMTEARISTAYALNEHLNPFKIDVDVDNDSVTLKGEVDNEAQRELAERLARDISGIQTVDNALKIEPETQKQGASNKLFSYVQDANTTARVEMQLLWDDTTSGLDIKVDTKDGTVTLTGNVATEKERERAERIATRTKGVKEVVSKLQVAPSDTIGAKASRMTDEAAQAVSDTWITARVAASIRFSGDIDHKHIHISTQDGVVTIRGRVSTASERDAATEIASEIAGVKRVDNQLSVTQSA